MQAIVTFGADCPNNRVRATVGRCDDGGAATVQPSTPGRVQPVAGICCHCECADTGGVRACRAYRAPNLVGDEYGAKVAIVSGVKPGERVVTQGAYQLKLQELRPANAGAHTHET